MKSIIILSLLINHAYAADCVSCTKDQIPNEGLVKNIEQLQATTEVNCENQLKEDAQKEYIANFGKLPKTKGTIKGLKLEGSAEEIKFLTKMLGEKSNDKWAKAEGCETVICALTRVYDSEEAAYRVLNLAKRDGYVFSLAKDFNMEKGPMGQLFKLAEIQNIDLAYKRLPASYKKLKTLDRLKRLPDGYSSPTSPGAAAYASPGFHSSFFNSEGEITFLESGTNGGLWASHAAVHELTHHVDFSKADKTQFGFSESPEFLKISGWKKTKKYETDEKTGKKVAVDNWEHPFSKKFISDYAGTEPAEDFGEAGAHYMLYPKKFKEVDPEKYEFMKKNIFKGKEYLDEPNLGIPDAEILKICLASKKEIELYGDEKFSRPSITDSCLDDYFKNYKYSDPVLCNLNPELLKNYLIERIAPDLDKANADLKTCDKNLGSYRTKCLESGNFIDNCAIEQCNLQSPLKEKTNFKIIGGGGGDKTIMNKIVSKLGRQNFLATALIGGLTDKSKIGINYSLNVQKYFLENASASLAAKYNKENFKFNSKVDATNKSERYLMMDQGNTEAITNFQENVLKKANRSKEKNLEMIKNWARLQFLEDTPMYDDLAEVLTKYGKN